MDNHKIMIVGTGNVGASIAFAILNQRAAINEIILTDIIAHDAEGEAMDLKDALAVAPSYVKIKNGTYKAGGSAFLRLLFLFVFQRR